MIGVNSVCKRLCVHCHTLQVFGTVGMMASHMNMSLATLKLRTGVCGIEVTVTDGINAILILTIIPLLDLLLVPMLRNCYATILKRLGVGATLAFLSILVLFFFETFGSHVEGKHMCMFNAGERETGQLHISVYWILLPLVMVTLAELFIYIPSERFVENILTVSLYNIACLSLSHVCRASYIGLADTTRSH